ncbi:arabinogalactan protein 41-like [Magnolia sinica]|uniref:arabinogalactan protein 41-like n=1 Tax=Magnolia sinica TaxID=86752 RepID=UPI002659F936|nr:arabinogalactan protein 41-like [Magnolia sinica]
MAISRVSFALPIVVALVFGIVLPAVQAQGLAPSPAPASDGTSIDQGIAYLLMLLALVLTYLIHCVDDASSFSLF